MRHLRRPGQSGFERPYGWAWLLKLAAELRGAENPRWGEALTPLSDLIARRLAAFLPIAPYPVRVGTHFNTAFALRLAADYAGDDLLALLRETALAWYGGDAECPAWGEPGGDDFLSPTLIEAEAMRRLLPPDRFLPWFDRFLPDLAEGRPRPCSPGPRDGPQRRKIAHLDGLNLSRAWCLRALARALPDTIPGAVRCSPMPTAISGRRCRISRATTWASTGSRASPSSPSKPDNDAAWNRRRLTETRLCPILSSEPPHEGREDKP